MNPILAGFLPLLATLGLTLTAYLVVGVFTAVMLFRQARGDFDIEDEGNEDQ